MSQSLRQTYTGSVFYNEEKTKSIEFLDALPVSRTEVYWSKVLTGFAGILLVCLSMAVSAITCGMLNGGETFVLTDALTIIKFSSFTIFFFMAVSCFAGGFSGRISAGAVGAVIAGISYMLGYLARLLEDKGEILSYFSPFELFSTTHVLNMTDETMWFLMSYLVLFILLIIGGLFFYKRRDFHI